MPVQKPLEEALLRLAKEKEQQWKLGVQRASFATKVAKRIRFMLRDVNQSLAKATTQ